MTDPASGHGEASEASGEDPRSGAGGSVTRQRSPAATVPVRAPSAIQRWVNEGGSLAPAEEAASPERNPSDSAHKEPRDTVAGCRDLAAKDRLRAAAIDTENGRRVLERSADSWEMRAHEIRNMEDISAQQRRADRDLWSSEEKDDAGSPD